MSTEVPEFVACGVCGRTILRGERIAAFTTPRDETLGVCQLCTGDARAAGWQPETDLEPEPPADVPPLRAPPPRAPSPLDSFNASEQPRKIAGLSRSLGPPSASTRAGDEDGTTLVTVAWELSWYRWAVGPGGEVRQIAHGDELDELEESDRDWNATVADDGRVLLEGGQ